MTQAARHLGLNYQLLAQASRIGPVDNDRAILRQAIKSISDWDKLITEAENNAVAPLLYYNLREADADISTDAKRKLYALVQRHKYANQARARALMEIVEACNRESIKLVVLKGAYLAHSIYPDPSLRTMSDIDLLAAPNQAQKAIEVLRSIGYSAPEQASSRYMSEHHHLPGATKRVDGHTVLVEVHHDALSGDAPASITFDNLTCPLNEFYIDDVKLYALGYQDQLRHLYHHMSEPAARLKLIWCVDIVFYASHFADRIDWHVLDRDYPGVVNALRLVDYIIPLPQNLRSYIPENTAPMPAGTGISILPLTSLLREPLGKRISDLLYPSNWWMRLYYAVPPGNSLLFTRWVRHPLQVAKWIYRRLNASRNSSNQS